MQLVHKFCILLFKFSEMTKINTMRNDSNFFFRISLNKKHLFTFLSDRKNMVKVLQRILFSLCLFWKPFVIERNILRDCCHNLLHISFLFCAKSLIRICAEEFSGMDNIISPYLLFQS